ncbi:MBL fold metallo-hydrolase [Leptolyngbya sp. FACHB-17]|uniref:MBL fold metallo-hydrolase n=1 Tax=unclassified Leptolyngbya TaxID=2650499 RepID=UPI001681B2AD|nr:MBL fold metallo-hydrolase [Leptolyngbya sp. FACHB-17]MBD2078611.1 MBL fold metallo-hydrolase [Leptolyngbya sp. FACHB-17]
MPNLLFLGSGSAFTVGEDNFHSNMLLTSDRGRKLLIDCGSDIRFSLYAAGLSYLEITDIFISHLHADHAGGLEFIGMTRRFDPRCDRANLYLSKDIASELWDRTLSGGMRSIDQDIATLDTYFTVHRIGKGEGFMWEGIRFELVRMIHVDTGFYVMPSYGLFFEVQGVKVFISGDSQLCLQQNYPFYEQADLIFHDCETAIVRTPVHAHYSKLITLPERFRRKMWLYGYQPGLLPDAQKDGLLGFVRRGQQFELSLITA